MSSTPRASDDVDEPAVRSPEHYARRAQDGDETWLEDAIEDYLGLTVTQAQQKICRALVRNEKVVVVTANGLGKSYILAAIVNVWLLTKYPAIAFGTSGTYAKLKRTFCKPVEALHDNALHGHGLPGRYKQQPPRIEIDGEPEHYFEAASPEDAGELEGVHTAYTLGIVEEADKKAIDEEVLDAMTSLVTDDRARRRGGGELLRRDGRRAAGRHRHRRRSQRGPHRDGDAVPERRPRRPLPDPGHRLPQPGDGAHARLPARR